MYPPLRYQKSRGNTRIAEHGKMRGDEWSDEPVIEEYKTGYSSYPKQAILTLVTSNHAGHR
jgi:hypothetical protein